MPAVPPVVAAPEPMEADELEQVSASLLTLDTVITLAEFELEVLAPLLLCALAEAALPAIEPLI